MARPADFLDLMEKANSPEARRARAIATQPAFRDTRIRRLVVASDEILAKYPKPYTPTAIARMSNDHFARFTKRWDVFAAVVGPAAGVHRTCEGRAPARRGRAPRVATNHRTSGSRRTSSRAGPGGDDPGEPDLADSHPHLSGGVR